jgi:capsular polysaccharide biosynthesis protein
LVIGPHGAGLSNLIFCSRGARVLELFPNESWYQPCYSRLSTVCQLKYNVAYINFENKEDDICGLNLLSDIVKNHVKELV